MKVDTLSSISGLKLLSFDVFKDPRGQFSRLYCQREFNSTGFVEPIVQINQSLTVEMGTIRGLHFQLPPQAESKWIRCLRGKIFDVAVDLRKDSPTFLKWAGIELSDSAGTMIFIPKGCAHGFQTLTDDVELIYFHSEFYQPQVESGISYNDPALSIDWPLKAKNISERDLNFHPLEQSFQGLEIPL